MWEDGGAQYTENAIFAVCQLPEAGRALLWYKAPNDRDKRLLGVLSEDLTLRQIAEFPNPPAIKRLSMSPVGELWVLFWEGDVRVYGTDNLNVTGH